MTLVNELAQVVHHRLQIVCDVGTAHNKAGERVSDLRVAATTFRPVWEKRIISMPGRQKGPAEVCYRQGAQARLADRI